MLLGKSRLSEEVGQRFLLLSTLSVALPSDLARLSARFSFRDLPAVFFVIDWRGDLSATWGPSIGGLWTVPLSWTVRAHRAGKFALAKEMSR